MSVSQIDLIAAICTFLDESGVKTMNARQYNAVIAAANSILYELETPHREATPGSGLKAWRASDDTGMSSMFMAGVLSGEFVRNNEHPHDPSDLGRCLRMLQACPELVPRLHRMKEHGPAWSALIDHWDELSAMYHRELPSGSAPETYKRMRELLDTDA